MYRLSIVGLLSAIFLLNATVSDARQLIAKQNTTQKGWIRKVLERITYRPKKRGLGNRGNPSNLLTGGGKRGCAISQNDPKDALHAIVPQEGIGLTTSTRPLVWIYSPYQTQGPLKATLTIRKVGENEQDDHQVGDETNFVIPPGRGLSSVQITQPVENGQTYKWVVTIECDADAAANPVVSGLLAIESNSKLQQSVQSESLRQQTAIYAQEGYWYDVLSQLVMNGVKADLVDFLKSGGLEKLIDKPISRFPKPKSNSN
jgi:hypothetical protein